MTRISQSRPRPAHKGSVHAARNALAQCDGCGVHCTAKIQDGHPAGIPLPTVMRAGVPHHRGCGGQWRFYDIRVSEAPGTTPGPVAMFTNTIATTVTASPKGEVDDASI